MTKLQLLHAPRYLPPHDNPVGWQRLAHAITRAQASNRCAAFAARLGQLRAEERTLRDEVAQLEARIRAALR